MAEKVDIIDVDTTPSQKSVKELRKELKQLKDNLLNLDSASKEYNQTLVQAGNIQHTLKEQMEEVNASAMDFGQILGNVSKVGAGAMGLFQSIGGAINLMGGESEKTAEMIAKMQNAMAITQGLSSIDEGVKGFKRLKNALDISSKGLGGFKKALIATGLGAIVVVLGSIIANWDEFTQAIGLSEEAMTKLKDVVNGVMGVLKSSLKGLTQAITKLVTGDFSGAWEAIKQGFDVTANYEKGVADGIVEREKESAQKSAEEWEKYVAKRKEQLEQMANLEEAKQADNWKYTEEGKKYFDNYYNELFKLYKKDSKEYNNILIQKLNYEKAYNKENQKEEKQKVDNNKKQYEIDLENRKSTLTNEIVALQDSVQNQTITYEEYINKKKELEQQYQNDYIAILENTLATETLTTDERIKLLEKLQVAQESAIKPAEKDNSTDESTAKNPFSQYSESITNSLNEVKNVLGDLGGSNEWALVITNVSNLAGEFKKLGDETEKGASATTLAITSIASTGVQAVSSIFSALASEQDATTKEGFEKQKKLQIASATFSMLSGIVSAMVNSIRDLGVPAGAIVGAALSSMVGIMGGVQIANIKKQKFDSAGSGVSSSSSNPSIDLGAMAQLANPVSTTTNVKGASVESDVSNVVSVVEIENVKNRVNVAETESTY